MSTNIESGDTYRHFKGGLYTVLCIAEHTEHGDDMVVYVSEENGKIYARPQSMFSGMVQSGDVFVRRFSKEEPNADRTA